MVLNAKVDKRLRESLLPLAESLIRFTASRSFDPKKPSSKKYEAHSTIKPFSEVAVPRRVRHSAAFVANWVEERVLLISFKHSCADSIEAAVSSSQELRNNAKNGSVVIKIAL